jgi:NhaA family Na+:H+ antiporter
MSLFISDLAFAGSSLLDVAKLGILAASLIAGIAGFLILRRTTVPPTTEREGEDSPT